MDKNTQTESTPPIPFQERVDVGLFFSGAQRRKVVEEVKKAIAEGVAVVTITGDAGTGKTMICHMVKKELPAECCCVYLPDTLESFDDVVRVLALGLGTETADQPESSQALVTDIVGFLKENDRKLVAVFDQAERMYLATVERIRKLLDQINDEGVLFQVILAGRSNLLENLEQLTICDFGEAAEKSFSLNPLGLSETYAYLNHSAQQRTSGRGKNVFTPEAAKKIYSMAQGNLRMTNILAAKSLEAVDSETSFMVLLENVHDQQDSTPPTPKKQLGLRSGLFKGKWLAASVGVASVAIVFFLFRGGDQAVDTEKAVTGKSVEQELSTEKIEAQITPQIKNKPLADSTAGEETKPALVSAEEPRDNSKIEKRDDAATGAEAPAADSVVERSSELPVEPQPAAALQNDEQAEEKEILLTEAQESETVLLISADKRKKKMVLPAQPLDTAAADNQLVDEDRDEIVPEILAEVETEQAAAASLPEAQAIAGEVLLSDEAVDDTIVEAPQADTSLQEENQTPAVPDLTSPESAAAEAEENTQLASAQADIGTQPSSADTVEDNARSDEVIAEDDQAILQQETEDSIVAETAEAPVLPEPVDLPANKTHITVAPLSIEHAAENDVSEKKENRSTEASIGQIEDLRQAPEVAEVLADDSQSREQADRNEPEVEPVVIAENNKRAPIRREEIEGAKKIVKIAPVKMITPVSSGDESIAASADTDAGQLYNQRLAAGESWLSRDNSGSHTIQLMVLTAEQAEENLKRKFEQDEYRRIAGSIYIIKKQGSQVFVFYGDYDNPEAARQARGSLPPFLREFDPYPLPITEAVAKAVSEQ